MDPKDGSRQQLPVAPMPFSRLWVYHTSRHMYIVGLCRVSGKYGILRLNRHDGAQLEAMQHPVMYDIQQVNQILRQLHAVNHTHGGLVFVTKAVGIIGCIRFTSSYYLLLVTKKSFVGSICGHKVYKIGAVVLVPLSPAIGVSQQQDSAVEKRYRKLLMGVDLTKNFYFSYTYSLAATLQSNSLGASAAGSASQLAPGEVSHSQLLASMCSHRKDSAMVWLVTSEEPAAPACVDWGNMFVWNSFMTRDLRQAVGTDNFGRTVTLTLLARRSRHFAGTRFKKRGLNDQGKVANEVETEQIVDAGLDYKTGRLLLASLVQMRGSVPLMWSQQPTSLSPKPEIVLQHFDPMYQVTQRHFDDLKQRYSCPVVVLNLLKGRERRPRETLLRKELASAIGLINAQLPEPQRILHLPWDFQKHAKQNGSNVLQQLSSITRFSLDVTGFFVHGTSSPEAPAATRQRQGPRHGPTPAAPGTAPAAAESSSVPPAAPGAAPPAAESSPMPLAAEAAGTSVEHAGAGCSPAGGVSSASHAAAAVPRGWSPARHGRRQHGVLRTNCIDCLDRTNVAQFAYGLEGFGRQLQALGLSDTPDIDSDSSIAFVLMGMYERMGNTLALQYGGSEAHCVFFDRKKGEWEATTQSKDLMTSIRRFYSNTYTDAEKQDAINLFLGNFVPLPGKPELWELETDHYLHSGPSSCPSASSSSQVMCLPEPSAPKPKRSTSSSACSSPPATDDAAQSALVQDRTAIPGDGAEPNRSADCSEVAQAQFQQQEQDVACARDNLPKKSSNSSSSQLGQHQPGQGCPPDSSIRQHSNGCSAGSHLYGPYAASVPSISSDEDETTYKLGPQAAGADAERGASWSDIWSMVSMLMAGRDGPSDLPTEGSGAAGSLVSFDALLSCPALRSSNVRLFVETKQSTLWQAAQQTFSFFWTANGSPDQPPAGPGSGRPPPGSLRRVPHQHAAPGKLRNSEDLSGSGQLDAPSHASPGLWRPLGRIPSGLASNGSNTEAMGGSPKDVSVHSIPSYPGSPIVPTRSRLSAPALGGPSCSVVQRSGPSAPLRGSNGGSVHGKEQHGVMSSMPSGTSAIAAEDSECGDTFAWPPSFTGLTHHGLPPAALLSMAQQSEQGAGFGAKQRLHQGSATPAEPPPRPPAPGLLTCSSGHMAPLLSLSGQAAAGSEAGLLASGFRPLHAASVTALTSPADQPSLDYAEFLRHTGCAELWGGAADAAASLPAAASAALQTPPSLALCGRQVSYAIPVLDEFISGPLPLAALVPQQEQQQQLLLEAAKSPLKGFGSASLSRLPHAEPGMAHGMLHQLGGASQVWDDADNLVHRLSAAGHHEAAGEQVAGSWPEAAVPLGFDVLMEGRLDGLLGTDLADMGLTWELMPWWRAVDQPTYLDEAFVHWAVAGSAAQQDYLHFAASTACVLPSRMEEQQQLCGSF